MTRSIAAAVTNCRFVTTTNSTDTAAATATTTATTPTPTPATNPTPATTAGLGSILLVAAVLICESGVQPLHSKVRPSLCVSPKDLVVHPHLHDFYEKLGFRGGRAGTGGNYELGVAEAALLLSEHGMVLSAGAAT